MSFDKSTDRDSFQPVWMDVEGRVLPATAPPVYVAPKRQRADFGIIMASILLGSAAMIVLFIVLYTVKSLLGIDIFPDHHLGDFL